MLLFCGVRGAGERGLQATTTELLGPLGGREGFVSSLQLSMRYDTYIISTIITIFKSPGSHL